VGRGEAPRRVGAGIDAGKEEQMPDSDLADAEWAANALRCLLRRCMLAAAVELVLIARQWR
jgi:hypothetical protein